MPWWIILIGLVIAVLLLDKYRSRKERKSQRPAPRQQNKSYEFVSLKGIRKSQEELSRLQPADEQVAQRVKKLFYSAAYQESRNVTAFHNILKELVQITKDILSNGGQPRMNQIADRVELLCGDDRAGFAEFISIMRRSYLPADQSQ